MFLGTGIKCEKTFFGGLHFLKDKLEVLPKRLSIFQLHCIILDVFNRHEQKSKDNENLICCILGILRRIKFYVKLMFTSIRQTKNRETLNKLMCAKRNYVKMNKILRNYEARKFNAYGFFY